MPSLNLCIAVCFFSVFKCILIINIREAIVWTSNCLNRINAQLNWKLFQMHCKNMFQNSSSPVAFWTYLFNWLKQKWNLVQIFLKIRNCITVLINTFPEILWQRNTQFKLNSIIRPNVAFSPTLFCFLCYGYNLFYLKSKHLISLHNNYKIWTHYN